LLPGNRGNHDHHVTVLVGVGLLIAPQAADHQFAGSRRLRGREPR
jgi:hypothetical protein